MAFAAPFRGPSITFHLDLFCPGRSGLRKLYPSIRSAKPFSLYIDEFDAFATESFATFLNKARSSGFMIHIGHQTLSDLNRVSADFAGQILGNCNVRFIFRQDDPDDAERWARFLGTRTVTLSTFQTQDGARTGMSSNRIVQEFIVNPDEIKSLGVGEAFLSIKTHRVTKKIKTKFVPASVSGELTLARIPESRGSGAKTAHSASKKIDVNTAPDKWSLINPNHGDNL